MDLELKIGHEDEQEEKLNVSCKVFTKYGDIYIKI